MRILVDMDGTINEFQNHFIHHVEKEGYDFADEYMNNYNVELGIIANEKESLSVKNKIFKNKNFWFTIPVKQGAFEGLRFLNNLFDVEIATVPANKVCEEAKIEWMTKYFPFIKKNQIKFVNLKKWELEGDVIIEDNPEILTKCKLAGFTTVKVLQPYNRNIKSHFTIKNWQDIKIIAENL